MQRDRLTVEVPLVTPFGEFPSLVAGYLTYAITPAGMTLRELQRHPMETGPFKYESFQAGVQSTFVANRDYWIHGKPYVDRLVTNSVFTDDTALYRALLAGDIDVLVFLAPIYAKQLESARQVPVLRAHSPAACLFYMDVTKPPFDDGRVRQAVKLLADRPALVQDALLGFGRPASDLFGIGCEYFASDLHRSQDIEQAKSLLKAAGHEGLSFTISTSSAIPAGVQAATLLSQQAQAAGVNISLRTIPAQSYSDPAAGFPWTVGQDYYSPDLPSLSSWWQTVLVAYAESRWNAQYRHDTPGSVPSVAFHSGL